MSLEKNETLLQKKRYLESWKIIEEFIKNQESPSLCGHYDNLKELFAVVLHYKQALFESENFPYSYAEPQRKVLVQCLKECTEIIEEMVMKNERTR